MKLKHRLSAFYIAIFSVFILVLSIIIYFLFYNQMIKQEFQSLENNTLLAALYYLEEDEVTYSEHNSIKIQLQRKISKKNILIIDSLNKKFSGDMIPNSHITQKFINDIRKYKTARLLTEEYFYNGIFYLDNQGDFVVITRESKAEINKQMNSLLNILIITFVLGVLIIYILSYYLSNIAYEPIIKIVQQIKVRDAKNFNQPLKLEKSYEEIQDLVKSYNHFIDRITETFTIQKNFTDYVSHELRTPITALLGTLEVTNTKKRTSEEYKEVMIKLNQYTNDLQETLDQMMLLSGVKTNFELKKIRIDEVIWKAIENAILYHHAYINVEIKIDSDHLLSVIGNEKLLEIAFNNIIGNAIKYSNNGPIEIEFLEIENKLQIYIKDQGIGIAEEDLKQIKQNFYRGKNTTNYQGKGIGLSMASIIFNLHHFDLEISNNQKKGITVKLIC